jgi:hypothetical protein
LRSLAALSCELVLRVALGIEFKNRAVGGAATRQAGSGDQPNTRLVEFGLSNGALRIGHDLLDRTSARPKPDRYRASAAALGFQAIRLLPI